MNVITADEAATGNDAFYHIRNDTKRGSVCGHVQQNDLLADDAMKSSPERKQNHVASSPAKTV